VLRQTLICHRTPWRPVATYDNPAANFDKKERIFQPQSGIFGDNHLSLPPFRDGN
jgi:hypothetical protein